MMEIHEVTEKNRPAFKKAVELHKAGFSYYLIAKKLGKEPDTVLRWLCPKRRRDLKQYMRDYQARQKRPKLRDKLPPADLRVNKRTKEKWDRRFVQMLDEAGPDTRPLEGKIYGDPLPQRSALHNWRPKRYGYTAPPLVPYQPEITDDRVRKQG